MHSSKSSSPNIRIYFFDALRAILIVFIIIIHISQIFNPEKLWLIYQLESSSLFSLLINFLMLFTLQSFFIMSGYFAILSIKKNNLSAFFNSKIKRTIIPILFTLITFNFMQIYLLIQFDWLSSTFSTYISNGKVIYHLWFLIDLTIFFLVTYLGIKVIPKFLTTLSYLFNKLFLKSNIYIILVLIAIVIVSLRAFFSIVSIYIENSFINFSSILNYLPFYILGILLFLHKEFFQSFINIAWIKLTILVAILVVISYYLNNQHNFVYKVIFYFSTALASLFMSAICFSIIYKYLNYQSKIFSFLANASYSIYLFHHLIVIVMGLIFIEIDINIYLKFMIIFVLTLSSSILLHHFLISKINLLSFLYNGIPLKRKKKNNA